MYESKEKLKKERSSFLFQIEIKSQKLYEIETRTHWAV